jgi:hypothetical protein
MLTNITLFKPKNRVELESVRKELINLNEEKTNQLFNYVFSEEYSHLDIDTANDTKRKNFKLLDIQME